MNAADHSTGAGLTQILVYIFAFGLFVWRITRAQRMTVTRLGVSAIVLVVVLIASVWVGQVGQAFAGYAPPPVWETIAALVAGAVLGIPLGMFRGRHSTVKRTDKPHVFYVQAGPIVAVIYVIAFAARVGVRYVAPNVAPGNISIISDALIAFAMSALITSYYAIYLKFKALDAPGIENAPA